MSLLIHMNDKIKVSLPLDNRKVDEIQETLGYNYDDKIFLAKSINVLSRNTVKANRLGLHDDASKLADLVRIASMHLEDIESQERENR